MSGKVIQFTKNTKTQKYRFDFGTDDKLYTVICHGKIPQKEIKKMLDSVQNNSYSNMAESIESYLEKHHLEYSNPVSIEIPLEKNDAMDWVNHLLHSDTYEKLDGNIEDADVYYGIMDYQKNTSEGHCEGCYYALKRLSLENGKYQYNIIAQTYFSKGINDEHGYFAIRESDGNGNLQDIDKSEGEPDLPTFGCVNMMALLTDIENINSKEDAISTAIK